MPKLSKTSKDSTDYGPIEEWADEFGGYAAVAAWLSALSRAVTAGGSGGSP